MTSPVTEIAPATADVVLAHYRKRLAFETDCADVHAAQGAGAADFVLCDVRGTEAYGRAHVPGAISLPVGKMSERRMAEWPAETLFVVYCAGPHCNGTDKAAIRLASLGRKVKVMIGGMTGWADEGYAFEGVSETI
jgi:rhodanese-related sulfurtransferase